MRVECRILLLFMGNVGSKLKRMRSMFVNNSEIKNELLLKFIVFSEGIFEVMRRVRKSIVVIIILMVGLVIVIKNF